MALADRPHPVFVLVGPDGGGKTTLANVLAASYGVPVDHHGPLPGLSGPELCAVYLTSMVPAMCGVRPVVMDRGWPCEEVYGITYRGVDRLSAWQRDGLQTALYACGGIVLYCLPPKEHCLAAYQSRKGEEYLTGADDLIRVYDRYQEMRLRDNAAFYDHAHNAIYLPPKPGLHVVNDVVDAVAALRSAAIEKRNAR